MAFGAHPDDVELFCSGLLVKLKNQGYSTGVIDLTAGELSTNGTVEIRKKESEYAAKILNLDVRKNLGLADGNLENSTENRLKIINVVREYEPDLVILPYWHDRHPDHIAASKLVSDSCFYSGLGKIDTGQKNHRPKTLFYYMMHETFQPTFIVDITREMEIKIAAINAHQSQFGKIQGRSNSTYINKPEFLESIKDRARFYGYEIKTKYGEPYYYQGILKIDNIMQFFA